MSVNDDHTYAIKKKRYSTSVAYNEKGMIEIYRLMYFLTFKLTLILFSENYNTLKINNFVPSNKNQLNAIQNETLADNTEGNV